MTGLAASRGYLWSLSPLRKPVETIRIQLVVNMNSLRVARVAARIRQSTFVAPLQRRSYADAVSDKIKLTLALPHQVGNHHPLQATLPEATLFFER